MENLRVARKHRNMTQLQVASHLGISRSAYSHYETGFRDPDTDNLIRLADLFGVSVEFLLGIEDHQGSDPMVNRIPLLGSVPAGTPIEAIEDVEEYIDIYPRFVKHGELFALHVKGDSMEPDIRDGDIAIIEKQEFIENGGIAIIRVNGQDATLKKVKLLETGLMLIPSNPAYDPVFFDAGQIATLPVTIIGKVIEIRRRM
jgi:repressor LexA